MRTAVTGARKRSPLVALLGGAAAFLVALTLLMAQLAALEKAIPASVSQGIITGFQHVGLFQEPQPVERRKEGVVNYMHDPSHPTICFNEVASDEIIVDAHPLTWDKVRLVDEPPRAEINADRKSACANWVAHDPNDGTNSAAKIAVVAHVKKITSPADGLRAAAVLVVVISSALIGCLVALFLGQRQRKRQW